MRGGRSMRKGERELLREMQECEFVYDTKIGKFFNRQHEIYKTATIEILELLYQNFERVRYVDDLSYRKECSLMFSEKFAMMDKRIPLPQVPFHLMMGGKNKFLGPCDAYFIVRDYLKNNEGPVNVFLNFRNKRLQEVYKQFLQHV
jgi:hypothetical protein